MPASFSQPFCLQPPCGHSFAQITFGRQDALELLAKLEEGGAAKMAVGAASHAASAATTSSVVRPSRCAALLTAMRTILQRRFLGAPDRCLVDKWCVAVAI